MSARTSPKAKTEALKAEVEVLLKELNRQMSHYQADSELSRFNRAPAQYAVQGLADSPASCGFRWG